MLGNTRQTCAVRAGSGSPSLPRHSDLEPVVRSPGKGRIQLIDHRDDTVKAIETNQPQQQSLGKRTMQSLEVSYFRGQKMQREAETKHDCGVQGPRSRD